MADYTMWIDHSHGESADLSLPVSRAVKQGEKRKQECQMKGLTLRYKSELANTVFHPRSSSLYI
jgi:hypothetical protein